MRKTSVSTAVRHRRVAAGSMLALATALLAVPAHGQQAAAPVSDPSAAPGTTQANPAGGAQDEAAGDIIVTGQRRAQRLQSVPASITAVSAEAINTSGFTRPDDLQRIAPSLSFNPSQGAGFQIRGVGTQGVDYNLEKAVATVVDDVVQGIPRNIGFNTLSDIDHVEVLRGPQGTLFGKNASGGVVFVVTQKPKLGVNEVIGRFRYGTGNEALADMTVNTPLGDKAALRVTGVFQRRDGTATNAVSGKDVTGYQDWMVKGKLLWQPTDDLEVYLLADYQAHRDTGLGFTNIHRVVAPYTGAPNTLDIAAQLARYGTTASLTNTTMAQGTDPYTTIDGSGGQANITYTMGDFTLTSITAYRHQKNYSQSDLDYTPAPVFDYNRNFLNADQWSHEIRLNSPTGGFLDYILGAYFYDLDVHAQERQGGKLFRTDLPANTLLSPVGGDANYKATSRSLAAFGQANLHFTPTLTGIVGGRFTHDRVFARFSTSTDPDYVLLPQTVIIPNAQRSDTASDFSAKGTLQWQPTRDLMFYGTVSQGYKAPAIATIRGTVRAVAPEHVTNYEAGVKSQLFDRALTLNATIFRENFRNFQTQTVTFLSDGTTSIQLANAGGLRSQGIEGDSALRLGHGFSLSGSLAYTDAKYTDFLTSCLGGQALVAAPGPGCYLLPNGSRIRQAAGSQLIYAPKWAYTVGANYESAIGRDWTLDANVLWTWRSRTFTAAGDALTIVPSYGLFNGNLGVGPADGRWRVGLYFRNLFDKFYVSRVQRAPYSSLGTLVHTTALDAQRTVGGQLSFRF